MLKKLHIILLSTALFLFFIHTREQYYYTDDDLIDFSNPSNFIETTSRPTKAEIQQKREIRQQLSAKQDNDLIDFSNPSNFIETTSKPTQAEIKQNREIRQQLSAVECTTRCDCCSKNSFSPDRKVACDAKYEKGSYEHIECMNSNSKYAHDACKRSFGKGFIFKSCK